MTNLPTIEIAGNHYPLCFSVAALEAIEAKFGGLDKFGDFMQEDTPKLSDKFSGILAVLSCLLDSGQIAAEEMGIPEEGRPPLPAKEKLPHLIPITEINAICQKVFACMNFSGERKAEADPPKNAMAPVSGAEALTV